MEISWTWLGCQRLSCLMLLDLSLVSSSSSSSLPSIMSTHQRTSPEQQAANRRKDDAHDKEQREHCLGRQDGSVAALSAACPRPRPDSSCPCACIHLSSSLCAFPFTSPPSVHMQCTRAEKSVLDCTYCHALSRCCRNAVSVGQCQQQGPRGCAHTLVSGGSLTRRPFALGLLGLIVGGILAGDGVGVLDLLCLRHGAGRDSALFRGVVRASWGGERCNRKRPRCWSLLTTRRLAKPRPRIATLATPRRPSSSSSSPTCCSRTDPPCMYPHVPHAPCTMHTPIAHVSAASTTSLFVNQKQPCQCDSVKDHGILLSLKAT